MKEILKLAEETTDKLYNETNKNSQYIIILDSLEKAYKLGDTTGWAYEQDQQKQKDEQVNRKCKNCS